MVKHNNNNKLNQSILLAVISMASCVGLANWRGAFDDYYFAQIASESELVYGVESLDKYGSVKISALFDMAIDCSYTLSYWIYFKSSDTDPASDVPVFWRAANGSYPAFVSPSTGSGDIYDTDKAGQNYITVSEMSVSNWTHVVHVANYSTTNRSVYYNGVVVGSSNAINTAGNSGIFRFFNDGYGGDDAYPRGIAGIITEAAMWTNALSEANIEVLYNAGVIPEADIAESPWNNGDLRAAWHFTSTTGNTETDISGNGYTATLWRYNTNTVWGSALK